MGSFPGRGVVLRAFDDRAAGFWPFPLLRRVVQSDVVASNPGGEERRVRLPALAWT